MAEHLHQHHEHRIQALLGEVPDTPLSLLDDRRSPLAADTALPLIPVDTANAKDLQPRRLQLTTYTRPIPLEADGPLPDPRFPMTSTPQGQYSPVSPWESPAQADDYSPPHPQDLLYLACVQAGLLGYPLEEGDISRDDTAVETEMEDQPDSPVPSQRPADPWEGRDPWTGFEGAQLPRPMPRGPAPDVVFITGIRPVGATVEAPPGTPTLDEAREGVYLPPSGVRSAS